MQPWTGSTLVQVMTCRLVGVKPLPALMLNWTLQNIFHWNVNRNSNIFLQGNTFGKRCLQNVDHLLWASMCRRYGLCFYAFMGCVTVQQFFFVKTHLHRACICHLCGFIYLSIPMVYFNFTFRVHGNVYVDLHCLTHTRKWKYNNWIV